ncbi:hypothetical protein WA026_014424 [Henosepilachna vigintioctopunctata]|uniref:Uncharacterized protein n=1 Tax=Henosepilachna vigintioctopunctata TaxID=420089 RepID=A0AAW1UEY3_9CUCU
MHSTKKNPKYRKNCGNKDSEDDKDVDANEDSRCFKDNTKTTEQPCIEIEMDDSVRNLLSSADKCSSALLDVTVIKQNEEKGKHVAETSTLKPAQVNNLLSKLEREKRDKHLLNSFFEDKVSHEETKVKICRHNRRGKMQAASDFCYGNIREKKCLKTHLHRPVKTKNKTSSSAPVDSLGRKQTYNHCYSPGVIQVSPMIGECYPRQVNCDVPSEESYSDDGPLDSFKCGDHKKTHHVYAASPRTFKDLNSIITCQSMSKDDRSPCLCDNCGIASLLSESQKRPIITAPVEHVSDLRRRMNKKEYRESSKHDQRKRRSDVPYACEDKSSYQAGLANLFERVKILEERMDIQEERAVPKDYFKRIITKIISHFAPRVPTYKNEHFHIRDSDSGSYAVEQKYKNNYSVNTLMIDKNKVYREHEKTDNHEALKKLLNNMTENMSETKKNEFAENFRKWGGDILKPGVDLKKKMLSLLNMTDEPRKQTDKTVNRPKTEESAYSSKPKKTKSNHSLPDDKDFNSQALKNLVEAMSQKNPKTNKKLNRDQKQMDVNNSSGETPSDRSLCKKQSREAEETKTMKKSMIPKSSKKSKANNKETAKNVDVSYLNPKLSTWQEEESQISFRLEFSDADTNTRSKDSKNRDLEKIEFLRTLSKTKDCDKEKLWDSIWAQAKANGQTKQDKVTIQLPRRNGSEFNDMMEIEFTIGEIEFMLTKHKYAVKNKAKS